MHLFLSNRIEKEYEYYGNELLRECLTSSYKGKTSKFLSKILAQSFEDRSMTQSYYYTFCLCRSVAVVICLYTSKPNTLYCLVTHDGNTTTH